MEEREVTEQGEAFIRGWYARIVDLRAGMRVSAAISRAVTSSTPSGCPAAIRKWKFFPKLPGQRKKQRGER